MLSVNCNNLLAGWVDNSLYDTAMHHRESGWVDNDMYAHTMTDSMEVRHPSRYGPVSPDDVVWADNDLYASQDPRQFGHHRSQVGSL